MIKIIHQGRTGNVLLQNVGVSIIAKKFDKHVDNYYGIPFANELGLSLFSGNTQNTEMRKYYDSDLLELLRLENIDNGIIFDGLFQLKEFVKEYKTEILSHFNLKYENKPEQVFVHVRLGDVIHTNPGLKYYQNALNNLSFKSGFISSDTKNHPIVQKLIEDYNLQYYDNSPIGIINFAKNFENLVLSKGTFSWWMGFLSMSKNIYYPTNDIGWHGDIFVFDDWKPLDVQSF